MEIQKEDLLKRRVRYFFETSRQSRSAVSNLVENLLEIGSVAIFGGMLRELALSSNKSFRSDIDLVIIPNNFASFEKMLSQQNATRNKFNGYRLETKKWKIDIWPLSKTWAHQAGFCELHEFTDLLSSTFFDWDAILYDVEKKKIIAADNYFRRLEARVLDINLAATPTPLNNALRALHYAHKHQASFGRKLAWHVLEQLSSYSKQNLIEKERGSFGKSLLSLYNPLAIEYELYSQLSAQKEEIILSFSNRQYELLCA